MLESKSPLDTLEDLLTKAWEHNVEIKKLHVSQGFFDYLANLCRYQIPPSDKTTLQLGQPRPKRVKKLIYSHAAGDVVIKVKK